MCLPLDFQVPKRNGISPFLTSQLHVLFGTFRCFALLSLVLFFPNLQADFRPPAGERYAIRGAHGDSILPGGRVIEPAGSQFPTGPGPFAMAVSPSGRVVVTTNLGPERTSLTVIEMNRKGEATIHNLFTPIRATAESDFHSLFAGVAFANEKQVWVSEGDSGRVRLVDLQNGARRRTLDLNRTGLANSFSGDLAIDLPRNLLYVVDQAHFRVVIFDIKTDTQIASVATGYLPYAIGLAPDGNTVWVTDAGLFRYHVLAGADTKKARETGIPFPAYGFPSEAATQGTEVLNGAGETVTVPALGDPGAPESSSACAIDVTHPEQAKVLGFVRTGLPFGAANAGGSGPSGILVTADAVYVSNAHNDTIDVIDPVSRTIRVTIPLRIPGLETLRGLLPLGMATDEARHWLLVAEAGINAIGVIDLQTHQLVGHIPVGWFPAAIAVREGRLFVSNVKGRGTGPSSVVMLPDFFDFAGVFRRGSLTVVALPTPDELTKQTRLVLTENGLIAGRDRPRPQVPVRYAVVIVRENRTFDEVFGDLTVPGGKVEGIPKMARYGVNGYADGSKRRFSLQGVNVTPNAHALAARFAFSDNFYADSDVSVDGHHWLVGAYPDAWTESSLLAAYSGQKSFRLDESAPGRLLFAESDSSVHPEEQEEAGSLWQHLEKHGIPFRNFGEGFELAGNEEGEGEKPTGARLFTNVPMPDALFRNTSRNYPGFDMNIPDQYRASQFIAEIDARYGKTGEPLPRLLFLHLPNDHTSGPRPKDGYPYEASYVADNDIALGRIVEYLSHSPWWREMAIFVTEDDAQSGRDHVDAHRTVLLGIGPYFKRDYCSHVNASFPSMLKTVFGLLGLPPLNLFDATASDLTDMFTEQPDFEPYTGLVTDPRLFDPKLAREPLDPKPSIPMDRR